MAAYNCFIFLPDQSQNWLSLFNQPLFPLQLLSSLRNRIVRWKACWLFLYAHFQLDLLCHNWTSRRHTGDKFKNFWKINVNLTFFYSLQYLMDPMVLSVLYIWCQLNKDTIVSFWFGTQFKAMYLPWVLMMFNMIIAGGYKTRNIYYLII